MPSFVLRDPPSPLPAAEVEEDPFARHARLLCEGKLMKELKKAKIPEPDRYQMFAVIADNVADLENEINSHLPEYTAKWRKTYAYKQSGAVQLLGLFITPVALLAASSGAQRVEFESTHCLHPAAGRYYWFRRLWTQLAALIMGVLCVVSAIPFILGCIMLLVADGMFDFSGWYIVGLGIIAGMTGYAFHQIERLAVPKPLRIYAGGTFELVSLKRVKTPKP